MLVFLFVVQISCGCVCKGRPHGLQIKEHLPAWPKYSSTVSWACFFTEERMIAFNMGVTGREEHTDET